MINVVQLFVNHESASIYVKACAKQAINIHNAD